MALEIITIEGVKYVRTTRVEFVGTDNEKISTTDKPASKVLKKLLIQSEKFTDQLDIINENIEQLQNSGVLPADEE